MLLHFCKSHANLLAFISDPYISTLKYLIMNTCSFENLT